jgi:CRISPR/Cas system CSM-associated protein Csm3 (group 7 of RAMP superfamily)
VRTLTIDYRLELTAGWHVGSGQERGTIDRAVMLDGRGLPFLPGSSLKGFVREQAERFAGALGLAWRDTHVAPGRPLEHFDDLRKSPFAIERLFGSSYQGGRLYFSDACMPEGDLPDHHVPALSYPRVAIDRYLGRARDQQLFSTEVSVAPAVLEARIRGYHRDGELTDFLPQRMARWPIEWALLLAGLLSLDRVGGDKSVGRGACKVTITATAANGGSALVEEILAPLMDESGAAVVATRFFDRKRPIADRDLRRVVERAEDYGGVASEEEWEEIYNEIAPGPQELR